MAAPARNNLSTSSTCDSLNHPFAQGTFRWVALARYTSGPRSGQKAVWKWFKSGSVYESDYYRFDVLAVEKAIDIVDRFNKAGVIDKPMKSR